MPYVDSRNANNIPPYLRGTHVSIAGTVASIRNKNPFVKSRQRDRQKMILLSPVIIAGKEYDHTWVHGSKTINRASIGDTISFFSVLKVYDHNGEIKWCPKFPYNHLKISSDNRLPG